MKKQFSIIHISLLGLQQFICCAAFSANIIAQGDTATVCTLKFPFVLNATPGLMQYRWSNGSVADTAVIHQAGKYWVSATDNGQLVSDTIQVNEAQLTTEILNTDNTFVCETDTPFSVRSNEIFNPWGIWNDGTIGLSAEVYQGGKYWLTSIDSFFCLKQVDTVELIVVPENAVLNFSKELVVCSSSFPFELNVVLGDSPLWNDSSTDYFFYADTPGVYWYEAVFGNCATIFDTITLISRTLLAPSLCCDTVVCAPDTVFLSLPAGFVDYYWSTGQNQQNIIITKVGEFDISVVVTDSANCSAETNSIKVEVRDSVPSLSITQNGAFLVVQPAGLSYQWFRNDTLLVGETTQAIRNNIRGVYCVRVSQGICFDTVCFSFLPDIINSIEDVTFNHFQCYPNPAADFLKIVSHDESEVVVRDVLGKIVASIMLKEGSAIVDVSSWNSGCYFVSMAECFKTFKFLKH